MIKSTLTLNEAKSFISSLQEKALLVTVNLGRNKYQSFLGKLSGVYPALFTVVPFEEGVTCKTSYSYSEYLCGKVKLKEKKQNKK